MNVLHTSDPDCPITIYNVLLLRKLLTELQDMKPYESSILHKIASLVNACFSQNISMIEIEKNRMENVFLVPQNNNDNIIPVFKVHPLVYMRILQEKGDAYMNKFRKLVHTCTHHDIGDSCITKHLTNWLLTTNTEAYREMVAQLYGNEL